jgi:hypothetical protein
MPPAHIFFKKEIMKKNKKRGGRTYGVVRPPQHIFIYFFGFFFLEFFFLEKKSVGGILGINRPNGLNCHNLKVWEDKVSHFKLLTQK